MLGLCIIRIIFAAFNKQRCAVVPIHKISPLSKNSVLRKTVYKSIAKNSFLLFERQINKNLTYLILLLKFHGTTLTYSVQDDFNTVNLYIFNIACRFCRIYVSINYINHCATAIAHKMNMVRCICIITLVAIYSSNIYWVL